MPPYARAKWDSRKENKTFGGHRTFASCSFYCSISVLVYALTTATYLINGLPSSRLDHKCPFQLLFAKDPNYAFLCIFGCAIHPLLRPYNQHKFFFSSKQCVFFANSPAHLGYYCFNPSQGCVYVARRVTLMSMFFHIGIRMHLSLASILIHNITHRQPMPYNLLSNAGNFYSCFRHPGHFINLHRQSF